MKKRILNLFLKLTTTLIDVLVIYSISYLLSKIIVNSNLLYVLLYVGFVYYLALYILFRTTFSKMIFGYVIVNKDNNKPKLIQIFFREIIGKFCLSFLLPFIIMKSYLYDTKLSIIAVFLLNLIILPIYLLAFKRFWWEHISKISTIKSYNKKQAKISFIIILILSFSSILLKIFDVKKDLNKEGFVVSLNFKPYSPDSKVKVYTDFLRTVKTDPVDYIFKLFENHDIVVIGERLHAETTQWDLIYKIVTDKRFKSNVGNMFTEYGDSKKQNFLDKYMDTEYANSDDLDKHTAYIMRCVGFNWPLWNNYNFFNFLRNFHNYNLLLTDSEKIKLYFCDEPFNWEGMTTEKWLKSDIDRDKFMADVIIDKFNEIKENNNRKKCLVIMNYRHSFGIFKNKEGKAYEFSCINDNTTSYLFNAYKSNVANVLLNTVAGKYIDINLLMPISDGKWDAAFKVINNKALGFDFNNSPFGDDDFDLSSFLIRVPCKYKEIYTGFIFWQQLDKHIQISGYPHMLDNYEDTILTRSKIVSIGLYNKWRHLITSYKKNTTTTENMKYGLLINLIDLSFFVLIALIGLLSTIISFFVVYRKNKAIA